MLRIRLQRRGRKKRPIHHIVVADSRAPRDGRIIEDLGRFDNITLKNQLTLNEERAIHWLQKGAQPSDTVRSILKDEGILYKVHLINWGKSEEEIEQALAEWRENRDTKKEKVPTRKEKQRALLEAEEKEYQKQLKKKAEEAAKQKAKEEALASAEEEPADGGADEEKATEVAETEEESEETPREEAQEEPAEEIETEEPEAGTDETEEKEAEAKAGDEPDEEESAPEVETEETQEETKAEEVKEEKAAESEKGEQVSTDMTAKDAIDHIKNTKLDNLEGFVPDEEDRVTVQRAWESKQEE